MKKTTTTLNELARLSNLTTRRLRQLSDEGKLPRISRGVMPWPEAGNRLFAHYQKVSEEMTAERLALVKASREAKEFENSREQGFYVKKADALRDAIGALKTYHGFVRGEIELITPETRRQKLVELGATTEIVSVFHAWDVQHAIEIISAIETHCEVASKSSEKKENG